MRPIDWSLWLPMLAASALEITGDFLMKGWAESNRLTYLAGGMVAYGAVLLLFARLLRRAELAVIFALWVGVAAVLVALGGWLLFGEALTVRRIAGVGLVVVGMVVLSPS